MCEERIDPIKLSKKEIRYGRLLYKYCLAAQKQSQEYNLVIQRLLDEREDE